MLTLGEFVEWALVKRFGESEEIKLMFYSAAYRETAHFKWVVPNQRYEMEFIPGETCGYRPELTLSLRDSELNINLCDEELDSLLDVLGWQELFTFVYYSVGVVDKYHATLIFPSSDSSLLVLGIWKEGIVVHKAKKAVESC